MLAYNLYQPFILEVIYIQALKKARRYIKPIGWHKQLAPCQIVNMG
jgi:hypothetical protein